MACRLTDKELEIKTIEPTSLQDSRDDVIRSILNEYLNQDTGNRQFRLIAVGEAGQGKSSLVNGILGEQLAPEGGRSKLRAATTKVKGYSSSDGTAIVWDTPGFGMADEVEEKRHVEEMATECAGEVDLMLYCISMESRRWPRHSDTTTIRMLTKTFGAEIWQYCLFVLTFANTVTPGSSEEDEHPDECFFKRVKEFEDNVKKALKDKDNASLSDENIQKIEVVAVGDPRPRKKNKSWRLPSTDDWFVDLWLAVTRKIQQSALPTLLKLNRDRIDLDENSANPTEEQLIVPFRAPRRFQNKGNTEVSDQSLDSGSEEEQATSSIHNRNIPIHHIIHEHLMINENSEFLEGFYERERPKHKKKGLWENFKMFLRGILLLLEISLDADATDDKTSRT